MVPAPFNATAYHELMDCVKNASTRYDVAVHRGIVVIIPPQGETIDLDTPPDAALGDCLDNFSPYLNLAVDDSRTHVEEGDAMTATQALATAEWAESHRAQGMTSQNKTQSLARVDENGAPGSPTLLARQVTASYWFSLGNMQDNCDNFGSGCDQQNNVYNECISFGKPYKSLVFSNPNNYNSIRVRMCALDYSPPGVDGRTITVSANADSQRCDHPASIFSFRGKIVPKNCFGSCA